MIRLDGACPLVLLSSLRRLDPTEYPAISTKDTELVALGATTVPERRYEVAVSTELCGGAYSWDGMPAVHQIKKLEET